MKILKFIVVRSAYAFALIFAVIILNFLLLHLAPGDIADTIAGDLGGIDEELLAQIRADYGLDKPLYVQLFNYIIGIMQLDFGYSFFFNVPVIDLILERVPATLLLVFTAQFFSLGIGIFFGVIAAKKPNGFVSHFVKILALFGYAAPVFWVGVLLLITFSLLIPIFPVAGMVDVSLQDAVWWRRYLDVLHHLFLPALTLSSVFVALYSLVCRAGMVEVLGLDYIRTARSKGLSERQIIYKHALKNALGPVVTLAGLQMSAVVSGAILVETVFDWPGLGSLALHSILARDTPTILGILFFSSAVVIVGNLLTDLVLRLLDPRITA